MKSVQNVTTKPLQIKAEIITVNGIVPITYKISPGGIYPLDKGVRYFDLDKLIKSKSLKSVGDEIIPAYGPDVSDDMESEHTDPSVENTELTNDPDESGKSGEESEESNETSEINTEVIPETDDTQTDTEVFKCPHCGSEYATQRGLNRHINEKHPPQE